MKKDDKKEDTVEVEKGRPKKKYSKEKLLNDICFVAWCVHTLTGKSLSKLAEEFNVSKSTLSSKFREWEKDEDVKRLRDELLPMVEKLYVRTEQQEDFMIDQIIKPEIKPVEPLESVLDQERLDRIEQEIKELKETVKAIVQALQEDQQSQTKPKKNIDLPVDLNNLPVKGQIDLDMLMSMAKNDINELKHLLKLIAITQWYSVAREKGIPVKGTLDIERILFGEEPPSMSAEEEEEDIEELLRRVKEGG